MQALVAFVSGRLGDRFGFKVSSVSSAGPRAECRGAHSDQRVLYAAAFLFWAGLFTGSFCTEVWQLILTQVNTPPLSPKYQNEPDISGRSRGNGTRHGNASDHGAALSTVSPPSRAGERHRCRRRRSRWWHQRHRLSEAHRIVRLPANTAVGDLGTARCREAVVDALSDMLGRRIFSFIALGAMTLSTTLMRTGPESPEAQGARSRPWIDKRVLKTSKLWSLAFSLIMFATAYGRVRPFAAIRSAHRAGSRGRF